MPPGVVESKGRSTPDFKSRITLLHPSSTPHDTGFVPRDKPHLASSLEVLGGLVLQAEAWEGREGKTQTSHKQEQPRGEDGASSALQLPPLHFCCITRTRSSSRRSFAPPGMKGKGGETCGEISKERSPDETTQEEKSFPQLLEK